MKCTRSHFGKGMCRMHWARASRHGDPLVTKRKGNGNLLKIIREAVKAETDECIILTGYTSRPNVTLDGTRMHASRAAWIIANGDPGDRWALHTCHRGEEGCINIRHLELGGPPENTRDMIGAGRSHLAKLVEDDVRKIRALAAMGLTYRAIAIRFGVSPRTISGVVRRKSWAWVDALVSE